jgi:hypothetical protein
MAVAEELLITSGSRTDNCTPVQKDATYSTLFKVIGALLGDASTNAVNAIDDWKRYTKARRLQ